MAVTDERTLRRFIEHTTLGACQCDCCTAKDAEIARLRAALETAQAATKRALEGCST